MYVSHPLRRKEAVAQHSVLFLPPGLKADIKSSLSPSLRSPNSEISMRPMNFVPKQTAQIQNLQISLKDSTDSESPNVRLKQHRACLY